MKLFQLAGYAQKELQNCQISHHAEHIRCSAFCRQASKREAHARSQALKEKEKADKTRFKEKRKEERAHKKEQAKRMQQERQQAGPGSGGGGGGSRTTVGVFGFLSRPKKEEKKKEEEETSVTPESQAVGDAAIAAGPSQPGETASFAGYLLWTVTAPCKLWVNGLPHLLLCPGFRMCSIATFLGSLSGSNLHARDHDVRLK